MFFGIPVDQKLQRAICCTLLWQAVGLLLVPFVLIVGDFHIRTYVIALAAHWSAMTLIVSRLATIPDNFDLFMVSKSFLLIWPAVVLAGVIVQSTFG